MRGRWRHRVDVWIFQSYYARATDLAVYRILYSSYVLLTYVPAATWLPHTPRAFFSPPLSLAALFTGVPSPFLLLALNTLLACCLSLLLLGWYTRAASVGTSLALILINSWAYSLGKIDHDILLVMTPAVLTGSGWGDALSFDARRRPPPPQAAPQGSWSLALLALLIAVAMCTAGWAKASTGWLNPATRATYAHLLTNYFVTGRQTWAAERSFQINALWLWKAADWSTVALELGFLYAMFRPRTMRVFTALACLFHCGVWLLFGIVFASNVVTYGAFLSYGNRFLVQRFREIAGRRFLCLGQLPAWALLGVTSLLPLTALVVGRPLGACLGLPLDRLVILSGAVIGSGYLIRRVHKIVRRALPLRSAGDRRAARSGSNRSETRESLLSRD